jgi:argininosuccinate lyase
MKGTLWGGDRGLDAAMDAYTVGEDRVWDRRLLEWDILGSLGHVEGLRAARLLTRDESERLAASLRRLLREARAGRFEVSDEDEDVHSAVEKRVTETLGALGARLHTGRSRNDQVLADLRLFLKERLFAVSEQALGLAEALQLFARRHRRHLLPGYTHQRRAMPSTWGLWGAGFAEALVDDLEPLDAALRLADRSPLGSAAGYGVPLPLDRERTARVLGFERVQTAVTGVQASRGKLEVTVLAALWTIAHDLAKLAWDVILFSSEEYGFLRLPKEIATGSSIMPHKKNPDVFELTRAKAALVDGWLTQAMAVCGKLPSGYHRDLQLAKGPLMRGLDTVSEMLEMMARAVPRLEVDAQAGARAVGGDLLATDEVFRRVREGRPFREAYREVAREVEAGTDWPVRSTGELLDARSHDGGAGRLMLDELGREIRARRSAMRRKKRSFERAMDRLARGARRRR